MRLLMALFLLSGLAASDLPEPQPIVAGAKVVTLWPKGSPMLKELSGFDKPEVVHLSKGDAPRVLHIDNIHNPSIELHLAPADKANGMAVIVAAGGGNKTLWVGPEGVDVANWLNGLGVQQEAHHQPAVVFTTAHDRYAVAAFEIQAIDYLMKPFGRRRLLQALDRVRERLAASRPRPQPPAPPLEPGPQILRLARTVRGELIPLRLDAATRFEAAGDYVEAHVHGERLLLRMSLGELEQVLDGRRFWRVHRSHLVAADAVKAVREHEDERRLIVVLGDGTEIVASRAASRRLRELIA